MESTHAIIQPTKAMQRSYDHLFIMYTLISFTSGLGATSLIQRNKENPIKDKWVDWTSGVFMSMEPSGPQELQEAGQVTFTFVVPRWGDPRATSHPHGSSRDRG